MMNMDLEKIQKILECGRVSDYRRNPGLHFWRRTINYFALCEDLEGRLGDCSVRIGPRQYWGTIRSEGIKVKGNYKLILLS